MHQGISCEYSTFNQMKTLQHIRGAGMQNKDHPSNFFMIPQMVFTAL